jgi:hypothetical protein
MKRLSRVKTPSWENIAVSTINFIIIALVAAERLGSGHELAAILIGGIGIGLPAGFLFVMYGRRWTAQAIAFRGVYIITMTAVIAWAKHTANALTAISIAVLGIGLPIGFVFFTNRKNRQAEKKV